MGRAYSRPQVEAITDGYQRIGGFDITRVVDPDDEFARTEWLCYAEETGYSWRNDPAQRVEGNRMRMLSILHAYELGYEDASGRARVAELGS